nr:hypothetical protein [Tanacetum cinerariifolium]
KSDALPFDEDDPEAEFKRYLRQAFDDDEHAEPVSLALVSDVTSWEIIPTEFGLGEIYVLTRADVTVKRFSTLRELMYWAGRANLMVLYRLVSDKYKIERATGIGLGLWMDLRTLITTREERDPFIIWDDQDQWQICSWRFYALPAFHILETEAGDIMYMFVDKKYPLTPETIQRMLNHGLEIDRDPSGGFRLLVHQRFNKAKQRGFKDVHGALSFTFKILMLLLILLAVLLLILTALMTIYYGNWTISKLQSSLGEDCLESSFLLLEYSVPAGKSSFLMVSYSCWLILLLLVQKFTLFGLTNWCCSLSAIRLSKGVDCLPNEEIFTELARMGYEKPSTKITFYKAFFSSQWKFLIHIILQCMSAKRTSWNEFSSLMASAVICLSSGRKFNFSKKQVGDLSTHTTKYTSLALTQKVFANMRRVGKGFLGVKTPLFEGMLVDQVVEEGDVDEHVENVNAGDVAEGDDSATNDEVPTADEEPSIPSPTPPTPPPQPSQDIPSTSQAQPTPPQSPYVQPQSPQPQPQPQQDAGIPMNLFQERVKKLERRNKVKVLKLRRLLKVGTTQRVETSDKTIIDDVSNQGRMIAEMDQDADVVLKDDKEEDKSEPAKVQEVVDVVTTTKIITEVVTTASETITAASITITAAEA